jgi:hypothetical protein
MLVLGTAAAALLSGCTSEIAGSATAGGEPRGLSDEARIETFCSDIPVLLQEVITDLGETTSDPASAVATLDEVVGRLEAVQPPDDVSDEWGRFVTAIRDMRDLLASVDPGDPDPGLAAEVQELQPELVEAGGAIDEWGQANC